MIFQRVCDQVRLWMNGLEEYFGIFVIIEIDSLEIWISLYDLIILGLVRCAIIWHIHKSKSMRWFRIIRAMTHLKDILVFGVEGIKHPIHRVTILRAELVIKNKIFIWLKGIYLIINGVFLIDPSEYWWS